MIILTIFLINYLLIIIKMNIIILTIFLILRKQTEFRLAKRAKNIISVQFEWKQQAVSQNVSMVDIIEK